METSKVERKNKKILTYVERVLNNASKDIMDVEELRGAAYTLQSDIDGIKGLDYSKDKIQTSHLPDLSEQVERMEERCKDFEKQYAYQQARAFWSRQLVLGIADLISDYNKSCAVVVVSHWAHGLPWDEIAKRRNCGVATIYRLRRLAIRELNDYHTIDIKGMVDAAEAEILTVRTKIFGNDSK